MAKLKTMNESEIKNPQLEQMMIDLKNNHSPEFQVLMFQQLLKATLLAPVVLDVQPKKDESGKLVLPNNAQVRFMMLNTNNGKKFFPLFTSIEEAKKMTQGPENKQFTVRKISDYKSMLEIEKNTDGLVVNPMNQNVIVPLPLAKMLSEGRIPLPQAPRPQNIMNNGPVNFSEPQLYPTAMVNAVYDVCLTLPTVSRVWLKQMSSSAGVALALIVERDDKEQQTVANIAKAAEKEANGKTVVILEYNEQLEKNALKDAVPLFDRELDA